MIEYSQYELLQKSALNRLDLSSQREGLLIRVNAGVGVIHPWPELGDSTVSECLEDLQGAQSNSLVRQALKCCEMKETVFVQDQLKIQNHATLPKLSISLVSEAVDRGFQVIKFKRGKDWMRLRKKTASIMESFPELRWRVDFNGALESHRDLVKFLSSVPRERIDFIEDPFHDAQLTERFSGFPLGYDWVVPSKLNLEQHYLIAKPAAQSLNEIESLAGKYPEKVIFTSYMDHPFGQLFALSQAQEFYSKHQVEPPYCGLVTHGLYGETEYSKLLGPPSPILTPPAREELYQLLDLEKWIPITI